MNDSISYSTRQELVAALRLRYQDASKSEKSRILNEFVSLTGSHRKHAIRVLRMNPSMDDQTASVPGRKIYDEAVREALVVVWEAADRICGKRLKAILPQFVESMQRHGHLLLDSEVKQRLLAASPATLDRSASTEAGEVEVTSSETFQDESQQAGSDKDLWRLAGAASW
jgi:hypothetical protein